VCVYFWDTFTLPHVHLNVSRTVTKVEYFFAEFKLLFSPLRTCYALFVDSKYLHSGAFPSVGDILISTYILFSRIIHVDAVRQYLNLWPQTGLLFIPADYIRV
jgi:hypothetical protein